MNNNLDRMEQSLRSIAKRYKTIKYSIGLAILFLMIGGNHGNLELIIFIIIGEELLKEKGIKKKNIHLKEYSQEVMIYF